MLHSDPMKWYNVGVCKHDYDNLIDFKCVLIKNSKFLPGNPLTNNGTWMIVASHMV